MSNSSLCLRGDSSKTTTKQCFLYFIYSCFLFCMIGRNQFIIRRASMKSTFIFSFSFFLKKKSNKIASIDHFFFFFFFFVLFVMPLLDCAQLWKSCGSFDSVEWSIFQSHLCETFLSVFPNRGLSEGDIEHIRRRIVPFGSNSVIFPYSGCTCILIRISKKK